MKCHLYPVDSIDQLAWPESSTGLSLDSPALAVLTDFQYHQPRFVDGDDSASAVERAMVRAHVRLQLVVDDNQQFLGLVSLDDLNSQEILKRVASGYDREELAARDFMRPRGALRALDYQELRHASVRDLVETLKDNEHQHYLVVDRKNHRIRGVISASDLARKLRLDIRIHRGSSFVAIYQALFTTAQLH